MRYFTPHTENSCFAVARREFPPNNVDAETLLGKTAGRVQSLPFSRPNDGRQAYWTTSFEGSEGLSALRVIPLPVTERGWAGLPPSQLL